MEEIRLKNRPSYYWEDIILLNKIDLDKNRMKKINFLKCAVFELNYLTESAEKPIEANSLKI